MMRYAYVIIFSLIILCISACNRPRELVIVKDNRYTNVPIQFSRVIYSQNTFFLQERYFVFNYTCNEMKFDSIAENMMCDALNETRLLSTIPNRDWVVRDISHLTDTILLSSYFLSFMDMGRAQYEEGDVFSTTFSSKIFYYSWDVDEPKNFRIGQKKEEFNCNLRPEYGSILRGDNE